MSLAADDPRHGTVNGYSNLHCRCQPCRDAWAIDYRRMKANRAARLAPDDPRHGRASTYGNYNCRCDACRFAWAVRYGHWPNGDRPRTWQVTPPEPPPPSTRDIAQWIYDNSTETNQSLACWFGHRVHVRRPLAARARGLHHWSIGSLDKRLPALMLADRRVS